MTDSPSGEKLQKILARAGLGSRREMERVIAEGRVKVNKAVAALGDRVEDTDAIEVDGQRVTISKATEQPCRVLLYNKPEGEICSRKDPEGRRSVFDRLPRLKEGRWIAVGRLDFNTSGLLLFTTDGELASTLMHPSTVIEREYAVRVMGRVDEAMLKRMVDGVLLDDGVARFTDVVDGGGEGINRWFYVVVMEGRNREVRRLWESQGVTVSRLKRVRYGNTFIPSKVKSGQWVEFEKKEVDDLYKFVGLPPRGRRLDPKERQRMERQERKAKPSRAPRQQKRR